MWMNEPVPEFLKPYLADENMQRLKEVDMNCGLSYTSFPLFSHLPFFYSRYDHSLNTALLAWHFTHDENQTLACLFHDIATPAFSHTIDFMHADAMKQEYTEGRTEEILASSSIIQKQLCKDGISLCMVSDYHIYAICDNPSPQLSCDRLEYIFSDSLLYGFADVPYVQKLYYDITAGINEKGETELVFQDMDKAAAFMDLSLRCGSIYSCPMDRYGMEVLAGIVRKAIRQGILAEEDLYRGETYVMECISHSLLAEEWQKFAELSHIRIQKRKEEGFLQIHTKKRYVNPYVKQRGRVTDCDRKMKERLDVFLSAEQNEWIKGD